MYITSSLSEAVHLFCWWLFVLLLIWLNIFKVIEQILLYI